MLEADTEVPSMKVLLQTDAEVVTVEALHQTVSMFLSGQRKFSKQREKSIKYLGRH